MVTGEYSVSHKIACYKENFVLLMKWIDDICKGVMENKARNQNNDSKPKCVIDIML